MFFKLYTTLIITFTLVSCSKNLNYPEWIWSQKPAYSVSLAKDFYIETKIDKVQLETATLEGGTIYLNGYLITTTHLLKDLKGHRIDITSFLKKGRNTIFINATSSTGFGGIYLCVRSSGRCIVKSDPSWKEIKYYNHEVKMGWYNIPPSDNAKSWGEGDIGRLKVPKTFLEKKPLALCLEYTHSITPRKVATFYSENIPFAALFFDRTVSGILKFLPLSLNNLYYIRYKNNKIISPRHRGIKWVTTNVTIKNTKNVHIFGAEKVREAFIVPIRKEAGCSEYLEEISFMSNPPKILGFITPLKLISPFEKDLRSRF